MLRNVIGGIRALLRRNRRNAEIQEELRSFQDASVEEKMRRGMSREAALRAARSEAGSAESVRQKVWAAGWESAADSLWQDLRYAVRLLAKSPGFTAVAVLTLALGIGANAAIFSVVNAVLLRPLPYASPGQLVDVSEANPQAGLSGAGVSYPAFLELRDHSRVFTSVAGLAGHALTLTGHGEPVDVSTLAVTPEFFSLFGTKPLLGRALSPEDGERGAAPVAVLSEQLWRNRFGADPGIVGRSIFGVISFSVSLRTREIGVRMALGATPASIRHLVIGESAKLVLFGLAAGIPAALILTHFLSALLFGVTPTDPLTFIGVALLLMLVALAAAYLPARRAIRIDPMVALRCE